MRHRALAALISLLFTALLLLILTPVITPFRLFTIDSESMVPRIPLGSVVFVNTDNRSVAIGEIIAFHPPTDPGQVFAHKVESILPGGAIHTEGIAIGSPDPWTLHQANIVGQVVGIVPYLGWIVHLLPVFSLLVLVAVIAYLVWEHLSPWQYSRVVLSIFVFTLTLVFLFDGLDPLIQSSVIFRGSSSTAVSALVINGGWLPLRAFTAAAPGQLSPPIAPNSEQLVHFTFPATSASASVINMRVIPALNLSDWIVLALVCLVPIIISAVWIRNEFLAGQLRASMEPVTAATSDTGPHETMPRRQPRSHGASAITLQTAVPPAGLHRRKETPGNNRPHEKETIDESGRTVHSPSRKQGPSHAHASPAALHPHVKYPPEFRQRVVREASRKGASISAVATRLGVSESQVRRWLAAAETADKKTTPPG